MKRYVGVVCLIITLTMTACGSACGGAQTYESLDEVEAVNRGESACSSDDDCIATFHCSPEVTCSNTQDQPAYSTEVCDEPEIAQSVLDQCACREGSCRWP